ncbi:MAG: NADH-quinone oxidoreductase subunit A [Bacteroidota bacterium]|nr:NADH-quinone oxidoreductase subunit A [Bacteroidota bacterium]
MNSTISEFGTILLFFITAILFVGFGLFLASIFRPHKPNYEKLTTYESGEEPIGSAWNKFTIKYYTIALIFILFEVELIFLFPWALIYSNEILITDSKGLWIWFSLVEVFVFVGILVLGLAYVWKKGYIDWVKPNVKPSDFESPVPSEMYANLNKKYT